MTSTKKKKSVIFLSYNLVLYLLTDDDATKFSKSLILEKRSTKLYGCFSVCSIHRVLAEVTNAAEADYFTARDDQHSASTSLGDGVREMWDVERTGET